MKKATGELRRTTKQQVKNFNRLAPRNCFATAGEIGDQWPGKESKPVSIIPYIVAFELLDFFHNIITL